LRLLLLLLLLLLQEERRLVWHEYMSASVTRT
jgi:hypothetical protein